jgi:hypothetical protein
MAPAPNPPRRGLATPQDISELPPERQTQVLTAMKQMVADSAAQQTAARGGRPVDLRSTPPPPPVAPKPEPSIPLPPQLQASTSPIPQLSDCPHCGWDLTRKEGVEATDEDKVAFVQAVLARERFTKSYRLLGGRVLVAFRSLTTQEGDLALTQSAYDAETPAVRDVPQLVRVLTDYRMCLSLARIEAGLDRQDLPEWLEPNAVDYDPITPRATVLKQVVPYVFDKVLRSEPLRIACAQTFYDFQRLVELLERRAADPNFWPAVGGPP